MKWLDFNVITYFTFIFRENVIKESVRITSKVEVVLHFYIKTFFTYEEYYVMMTRFLINRNVLFIMFLSCNIMFLISRFVKEGFLYFTLYF